MNDLDNNQLHQWYATEEGSQIYGRYGESAYSPTIVLKKKFIFSLDLNLCVWLSDWLRNEHQWHATEEGSQIYGRYGESAYSPTIVLKKKLHFP